METLYALLVVAWFVILLVIFPIGAYMIANSKNRDAAAWFIFTLIFLGLPFFIVAFLPPLLPDGRTYHQAILDELWAARAHREGKEFSNDKAKSKAKSAGNELARHQY